MVFFRYFQLKMGENEFFIPWSEMSNFLAPCDGWNLEKLATHRLSYFFINKEQITCHSPIYTGKKINKRPYYVGLPQVLMPRLFLEAHAHWNTQAHMPFVFLFLVDFFKKIYPSKLGLYFVTDFFFFNCILQYFIDFELCYVIYFSLLFYCLLMSQTNVMIFGWCSILRALIFCITK